MATIDMAGGAEARRGLLRRAAQVGTQLGLQAVVLFAAAGTLRWAWAWVFLGLSVLMIAGVAASLLPRRPQTIVERGRAGANWKRWDRLVGTLFTVTYFALLLLVAGLDRRYGWTGALAPAWHLAGVAGFVAGGALFGWALAENAFFATTVRIQEDKGHTVCTSGPYRVVRHPGYVGIILQALAQPLLFGSLWALAPASVTVGLLVVRTALEDRTLRAELPGYAAYSARTRYRLVPGLW